MECEEINMESRISEILKRISFDFVALEEEINKWQRWQENIECRVNHIQTEAEINRNALKDAANAILNNFN